MSGSCIQSAEAGAVAREEGSRAPPSGGGAVGGAAGGRDGRDRSASSEQKPGHGHVAF